MEESNSWNEHQIEIRAQAHSLKKGNIRLAKLWPLAEPN